MAQGAIFGPRGRGWAETDYRDGGSPNTRATSSAGRAPAAAAASALRVFRRQLQLPGHAGVTPTGGLARARARDIVVAMAEIAGVEF